MKPELSTPRLEPSTPPSQAFHIIDCLSGVGRLKASKTAVPLSGLTGQSMNSSQCAPTVPLR